MAIAPRDEAIAKLDRNSSHTCTLEYDPWTWIPASPGFYLKIFKIKCD